MINIIMLALFVEAVVSAIKPLWKDGGEGLSVTEIVSIVVGVVMAVALRIDLFSVLVEINITWDSPAWVYYLFYVMSGIAIGRGPSFVYDLWQDIKKWSEMNVAETIPAVLDEVKAADGNVYAVDLNIENWSVARLREFCAANNIPATSCVTKEEYINAIVSAAAPEAAPEAEVPNCADKDYCDLDDDGYPVH